LFHNVVVIREHYGVLLFLNVTEMLWKDVVLECERYGKQRQANKDLTMLGRGLAGDDESFAGIKLFAQFWARYIILHFSL
jgi:hypothetical protein